MSKANTSQRDVLHRRIQETSRLLSEREMQIRFLASELQRKEYATLSLSEVIGALFTSCRSIVTRFEDLNGTTNDGTLDAYIVQLDQVLKIYQKQAEPPPGQTDPINPPEGAPAATPLQPVDGGGSDDTVLNVS